MCSLPVMSGRSMLICRSNLQELQIREVMFVSYLTCEWLDLEALNTQWCSWDGRELGQKVSACLQVIS